MNNPVNYGCMSHKQAAKRTVFNFAERAESSHVGGERGSGVVNPGGGCCPDLTNHSAG